MFIEVTWIVRSRHRCFRWHAAQCSSTTCGIRAHRLCRLMAHSVVAKALVFETQREAAEAARVYGERWIA